MYFSYKRFHSGVLLALIDAEYKFIWYNIAATGSNSDAKIFNYGDLRQKIEDNTIGFPSAESLADNESKVHYFILSDEAFPNPSPKACMDLKKRVSNYMISHRRRVGENAFRL